MMGSNGPERLFCFTASTLLFEIHFLCQLTVEIGPYFNWVDGCFACSNFNSHITTKNKLGCKELENEQGIRAATGALQRHKEIVLVT